MVYSPPATGLPDPMTLSSFSDDLCNMVIGVQQAASSAAFPAANDAIFIPARLVERHAYVKAWWVNGATANGNVDVGIYTLSGTTMTRVVASTAEAQGTVSTLQVAGTFTTTTIGPGAYYLAISCTSGTATFIRASTSALSFGRFSGTMRATSSSPLPSSCTAVATNSTFLPLFGFSENAAI